MLICGDSRISIETIVTPKGSLAHANSNIQINPFDQEIVWITVNEEYNNELISPAGKKTVIEMVVTRQEGDKIPIVLTNPTAIPRKINRGEIIAEIAPVDIAQEIRNDDEFINYINSERLEEEDVNTIKATTPTQNYWKPGDRINFSNKSLTEVQKQKLRDLINEYHMVFSKSDEDIGKIDKRFGQHDIKLTDDSPISQRPYKTPHAKEQIIKESLEKMQKMGVVEPTESNRL